MALAVVSVLLVSTPHGDAPAAQLLQHPAHLRVGVGLVAAVVGVNGLIDPVDSLQNFLILAGGRRPPDGPADAVAHKLLVVGNIPAVEAVGSQSRVQGVGNIGNGAQQRAVQIEYNRFTHSFLSRIRIFRVKEYTEMPPLSRAINLSFFRQREEGLRTVPGWKQLPGTRPRNEGGRPAPVFAAACPPHFLMAEILSGTIYRLSGIPACSRRPKKPRSLKETRAFCRGFMPGE